ncbi:MAG: Holliday junction resolvase RuvX [Spirochaetia bacterium]|nr:Holliday junction resolvase RuvX [Spirochaetia bacterium]
MSRILSIDYGRKYIGLAVTCESQIAISNLTALKYHKKDFWDSFFKILKEYSPKEIIIGVPLLDDREPTLLTEIENFSKHIKKNIPEINIILWDESLSSVDAEIIYSQKTGKYAQSSKKINKKKEEIHSLSAHLILRSYLDRISH